MQAGEPGGGSVRAAAQRGGAHPTQLPKGLLAALAVTLPPPGRGTGSRSRAGLPVLGFSGEGTGCGRERSLLGPLEGGGLKPPWSRAGPQAAVLGTAYLGEALALSFPAHTSQTTGEDE